MFVKEFTYSTWVRPKPFPIISRCIKVPLALFPKDLIVSLREAVRLNFNALKVYCPGNGVISQDLKMTWQN